MTTSLNIIREVFVAKQMDKEGIFTKYALGLVSNTMELFKEECYKMDRVTLAQSQFSSYVLDEKLIMKQYGKVFE